MWCFLFVQSLGLSVIRTISGSPMNAVGVNQDVLSAWGTYSEIY